MDLYNECIDFIRYFNSYYKKHIEDNDVRYMRSMLVNQYISETVVLMIAKDYVDMCGGNAKRYQSLFMFFYNTKSSVIYLDLEYPKVEAVL